MQLPACRIHEGPCRGITANWRLRKNIPIVRTTHSCNAKRRSLLVNDVSSVANILEKYKKQNGVPTKNLKETLHVMSEHPHCSIYKPSPCWWHRKQLDIVPTDKQTCRSLSYFEVHVSISPVHLPYQIEQT